MGEPAAKGPLQARRPLSIVLVRPGAVLPAAAASASYELPPIGLAYLAAALTIAGHRVRIIDSFGEEPSRVISHADGYTTKGITAEQVVERIPRDVDLIGVGCMFSSSWLYCRRVIAHIAAGFPSVPLIVGGEHVTADYHRLLQRVPEVLCCVLGEGDETIVDIAAHLSHGMPLDDIPGIALRDTHGAVLTTPDRHRIRDVDEIPWPNWDTVPLSNYLDRNLSHDPYLSRTMPMLASRGCPYQCTFCSSPQMLGTSYAARSPRKLFEEMRHYYDTLGARHFEFHDLTMIIRKEWIVEFSKTLIDAGLDIEWTPSGTRSEVLDGEVLALMKRSGCRAFAYAAESGSTEELKRIKKHLNIPRMFASMREAVKLGLVTNCQLIFGLPEQTRKDVLITLGFVTRLAWVGVNDIGCYAFSPYPGSALYRRLIAEGLIDREAEDFDKVLAQDVCTNYKLLRSWTPHLPSWLIGWLCVGTMVYFYSLQFLFRPQRLLVLIQSLIRNQKHTYLEGFLLRRLGRAGSVRSVAGSGGAHQAGSSSQQVDGKSDAWRAVAPSP